MVLVVGVNGAGKTTTVGKIAGILVAEELTVTLGAADTFRAAAVDQLATWGERVGVEAVRGPEGGDPASVAFEAVRQGVEQGIDTVLVDTAGRLQNKAGLMDELGKVKRVIEKRAPVTEVLLVLDATTGQNGLIQARVFSEIVDVTGIVLTKLDGYAKAASSSGERELGVGQARRPRGGPRRHGAVRRRRVRRRPVGLSAQAATPQPRRARRRLTASSMSVSARLSKLCSATRRRAIARRVALSGRRRRASHRRASSCLLSKGTTSPSKVSSMPSIRSLRTRVPQAAASKRRLEAKLSRRMSRWWSFQATTPAEA